jgi:hypothetical protein
MIILQCEDIAEASKNMARIESKFDSLESGIRVYPEFYRSIKMKWQKGDINNKS